MRMHREHGSTRGCPGDYPLGARNRRTGNGAEEAKDEDNSGILAISEETASVPEDRGTKEEAEDEKDIMTLIGELDTPEVTAFDYELELVQLPESKQEANATPTPPEATTPEKEEVKQEEREKKTPPQVMDLELID